METVEHTRARSGVTAPRQGATDEHGGDERAGDEPGAAPGIATDPSRQIAEPPRGSLLCGDRPSGRELLVVAVLALAAVCAILRPFPLDVPVVYTGDTFQHLALIEAADWTGTPGTSPDLAAPHGLDWSVFPTGTERLHLVALNALDEATGDPIAAMNLYVVLALVCTALVAHALLRRLGATAVVAGAVALVVTVSPSALLRLAAGHLFLFSLLPVALGVYLALWAIDAPGARGPGPQAARTAGRWRPGAWVAPLAAGSVIALSSAYYAAFTVLVVGTVAGLAALRRGDLRRLVAPGVLLLAIVAVAGASLAPDLLTRRGDAAAQSLSRPVRDSDTYGLRVAQMVLPRPDHPVGVLGDWGERAYRTRAPGDRGAAIGLAGVAGLLVIGVVGVRRIGRERDRTERRVIALGAVAGTALCFAVAGGGGFVLATLGLTQVRAWSRLAPFVLLSALAALGLVAQRRWGGHPRFAAAVVVAGVLAVVDHGAWSPPTEENRLASREDSALVQDLLERVPEGSLVAQLPVVSFPDDLGADRLLAPAVHADGDLRFTAGAFRGGPGDWQESWLAEDPALAARAAAAAGASILLVQRSHWLVEDEDALERRLGAATGSAAHRSDRDAWVWFDLRPLRSQLLDEHGLEAVDRVGRAVVRPIGVGYEGSSGREYLDGRGATLLGPSAALTLHRGDADRAPVTVRMRLTGAEGTRVTLTVAGRSTVVEPGAGGELVELEVPLDSPTARVDIDSVGTPMDLGGTDGPALVRLSEVTVRDTEADTSPVLR